MEIIFRQQYKMMMKNGDCKEIERRKDFKRNFLYSHTKFLYQRFGNSSKHDKLTHTAGI